MRGLACATNAALMSRRASGLSAAESLRLEEHLSSCQACQHEADLLGELRELALSFDPVLTVPARHRAMQRALHEKRDAALAPRAASRSVLAWGGAALVAAAVALLVLRAAPETAAPIAHEPDVVAPERVVSPSDEGAVLAGAVVLAGEEKMRGSALPAGAVVRAKGIARVAVGHAEVELQPQTAVRWEPASSELVLLEGTLVAEVDPKPKRPFAVVTDELRAEVLGTRFEVSPEHVVVTHGRVRVVSHQGVELAVLGAGERYDAASAEAATERAAKRSARPAERAAAQSARELLAIARGELARGDVGSARGSIARAIAGKLSRSEHAEALTLRAECAAFAGEHDAAVRSYLEVARRFADLPAGETALFAAARSQAERGKTQVARALLQRYLKKYPRGRFSSEAENRLGRLDVSTDP